MTSNNKTYQSLAHTFAPVCDEHSEILILGTFPSAKSREQNFYYGHPQNRFWKMIAVITGSEVPETIEEKKKLLLANHIAIWDVIKSCEIIGSSDSSIKNVVANDIAGLLKKTNIKTIVANGATAERLYNTYALSQTGIEIIKLPSTSPANAAWRLERLCEEWGKIIHPLSHS
ncbi:MAG: DNA-deoxyinosine glycosylase [Lachnospiraceae bacterium]|nr:DNA-deoxyinosine glycosylase [Lachnospiraceae bacterium]